MLLRLTAAHRCCTRLRILLGYWPLKSHLFSMLDVLLASLLGRPSRWRLCGRVPDCCQSVRTIAKTIFENVVRCIVWIPFMAMCKRAEPPRNLASNLNVPPKPWLHRYVIAESDSFRGVVCLARGAVTIRQS